MASANFSLLMAFWAYILTFSNDLKLKKKQHQNI